jgi:hypothetical protein
MGDDLMGMDAPKNGAMLFELTTPSGRATHAGVLEFTAPEGCVQLPRKVIRSLWGRQVWTRLLCGIAYTSVTLKIRLLFGTCYWVTCCHFL